MSEIVCKGKVVATFRSSRNSPPVYCLQGEPNGWRDEEIEAWSALFSYPCTISRNDLMVDVESAREARLVLQTLGQVWSAAYDAAESFRVRMFRHESHAWQRALDRIERRAERCVLEIRKIREKAINEADSFGDEGDV